MPNNARDQRPPPTVPGFDTNRAIQPAVVRPFVRLAPRSLWEFELFEKLKKKKSKLFDLNQIKIMTNKSCDERAARNWVTGSRAHWDNVWRSKPSADGQTARNERTMWKCRRYGEMPKWLFAFRTRTTFWFIENQLKIISKAIWTRERERFLAPWDFQTECLEQFQIFRFLSTFSLQQSVLGM